MNFSAQATLLIERIKAYSFPGGVRAAHGIRGIKTVQRGEIRSSADSRWISFTAGEYVNATGSGFCWEAKDLTGTSVDVEVDNTGRIVLTRAVRPMAVGSKIVMTPWSATANEFQECEGLRIPYSMEAAWDPPEGTFTYVRIALRSVTIVR